MLTIAPERCRRIIGSTCLQAMIVPRRLIADTRSNTASVSSSSGLSPPATLTPTLLCRMPMRPAAAPSRLFAAALGAAVGEVQGQQVLGEGAVGRRLEMRRVVGADASRDAVDD